MLAGRKYPVSLKGRVHFPLDDRPSGKAPGYFWYWNGLLELKASCWAWKCTVGVENGAFSTPAVYLTPPPPNIHQNRKRAFVTRTRHFWHTQTLKNILVHEEQCIFHTQHHSKRETMYFATWTGHFYMGMRWNFYWEFMALDGALFALLLTSILVNCYINDEFLNSLTKPVELFVPITVHFCLKPALFQWLYHTNGDNMSKCLCYCFNSFKSITWHFSPVFPAISVQNKSWRKHLCCSLFFVAHVWERLTCRIQGGFLFWQEQHDHCVHILHWWLTNFDYFCSVLIFWVFDGVDKYGSFLLCPLSTFCQMS